MDDRKVKRMEELVKELNKYAYEYYVLDNPTISDMEYDVLYYELVDLEEQLGYKLDDSPTHRVGGAPLKEFVPYTHKLRLYSLDKAKGSEELEAYFDKMIKFYGYIPDLTIEHKFDGLTLSITYNNGVMVRATTRGDGVTGETVTEQVKTIRSVPLKIKYTGEIEIQGEGLMSFASLERYNKYAQVPLKNARNGVAGAIRNLDPKVTASRMLDFVAYNVGYSDKRFETQEEVHSFLKENGFLVDDIFTIVNSLESTKKMLDKIEEGRQTYMFPIDGAVLKIDKMSLRDEWGVTEKFPRWALAYKFDAEETTTLLKDVIWQVSRTRKLNPLAILEPVDLMGVTVQRATLNNWMDIQRKGVKINSRVFIRRSNDVIPEITGLASLEPDSRDIPKPIVCPACGAPVIEDGAFLYCSNPEKCAPAVVAVLDHFAEKGCMDIDGFSEKTAELLYNNFEIKKPHQLYKLTLDQLLTLDGFKEKKAQNLLDSLEKSKQVTLDRFIFSLGIPTIGKKAAKQLADKYGTLDAIKNATIESLLEISDFGEIMANYVIEYMHSEENIQEIDALFDCGIQIIQQEQKEGVFSGKTVVLTGSLHSYKRSQAANEIVERGGKMSDTVSKNVNLVIVGEDPGSKLEKAEKLGIEIWNEERFLEELKK